MEEVQQEVIKVRKIKHEELNDYYVSAQGEIFNQDFVKVAQYLVNGYYIFKNSKDKGFLTHRVVAMTYIKNPNNCPVVNHIDENKLNNNVNNLEWVTQKENCAKHGKDISHPREVIQLDMSGMEVARFKSITEAGTAIGLSRHAVNRVCLGKNKTAGGYMWKYSDEDNVPKKDVDITGSISAPDYPNYLVFPNGTIYNSQRKQFMKPIINAHGSNYVTLSSTQGKKNKYVHNLVAQCFIPNPKNCKNVRHITNDKNDNDISNLEWY